MEASRSLVLVDAAPAISVQQNGDLEKLREARGLIPRASVNDLAAMVAYSDAIANLARMRKAAELAREAVETRIRAQRRIGELAIDDTRVVEQTGCRPSWIELAAVPRRLFDRVVVDLVGRDLTCTPTSVLTAARRSSLRKQEPGIYQSFDGAYWVERPGTKHKRRIYGEIHEARRELERLISAKKRLGETGAQLDQLDELHARSRRLGQAINMARAQAPKPARNLLATAELKQAEVSEILYRAFVEAQE